MKNKRFVNKIHVIYVLFIYYLRLIYGLEPWLSILFVTYNYQSNVECKLLIYKLKNFHIDTSFAGAATESWRNAPNATTPRMYVRADIVARERRCWCSRWWTQCRWANTRKSISTGGWVKRDIVQYVRGLQKMKNANFIILSLDMSDCFCESGTI